MVPSSIKIEAIELDDYNNVIIKGFVPIDVEKDMFILLNKINGNIRFDRSKKEGIYFEIEK